MNIREATNNDVQLLFEWANDPITRLNSFNSTLIEYDQHCKWLNNKINDPNYNIYIFYSEEVPIGVIKIESKEENVIGVSVAAQERGKGFGSQMIKLGCEKFWENSNGSILAYIKKDNLSSRRAFEKAGFTYYREDIYNDIPCLILIYSKNEG